MGVLTEFLRKEAPTILAEAEEEARAEAEWAVVVDRLLDQLEQWVKDADPDQRLQIKRHRGMAARLDAAGSGARWGGAVPSSLEIRLADRVVKIVTGSRSSGGRIDVPGESQPVRPSGRVDFMDGLTRTHSIYRVSRPTGDEWYVGGVLSPARPLDRSEFEVLVTSQLK